MKPMSCETMLLLVDFGLLSLLLNPIICKEKKKKNAAEMNVNVRALYDSGK